MKPHRLAPRIVYLVALGSVAGCVSKKEFSQYQQEEQARWDKLYSYEDAVHSWAVRIGIAVCQLDTKVPNLTSSKQVCPGGGTDMSTPPPPSFKP